MTEPIKAIIVDDEKPARERIRFMLKDQSSIKIITECKNGLEAIKAVEKYKPDLMFLDIQMPGLDGFEVIKNLDKRKLPTIIFITAFDNFAVKAFEVNAVDYLLKPYNKTRFKEALNRAEDKINNRTLSAERKKYYKLPETHKENNQTDRLVIKTNESIEILTASNIDYIESAGNYVQIHIGKKKILYRSTMSEIEQKLNQQKFVRVHRFTIINIDKIKNLKPLLNRDYRIYLTGGGELTLSRRYRQNLENLIGRF